MSCKTPVTILQELMVRRKENPNYDLICNLTGTHEPLFKYEVTGLGMRAIGSGKSKKEAKHEAARLLLFMLKDTMDIPDLEKSSLIKEVGTCYSPYDDTIKDNAVGALQLFCCESQLQDPKYELVLDIGPPHFKLFTIRCTVSSFVQEATARTKKQAKHRCSASMLQKLKLCFSDYLDCSESSSAEFVCCDLAKRTMHLGYPISDLHNIFKSNIIFPSPSPSLKLQELNEKQTKLSDISEPMSLLKVICEELTYEIDEKELPSFKTDILVVNIFLISKPGWSFIGLGKNYEEAVNKAASEAIEFLMEMTLEFKKNK